MWAFIITSLLLCPSNFPNLASAAHSSSGDDDELQGFDLIYQFGDSISDTGNLMRESNSSVCSFTPYGETLGKPTGRCSNGLLIIDYLAKAFNKPLLNPYLDKDADFSQGVNFAVAGATALDASRFPAAPTNSSLDVQLRWFRNHLESTCSSPSDCKHNFERALFLMGEVGANDYNYAFFTGNSIENVLAMVPEVVQTISNAVKEVIEHGARLVVVPGNFPIGCAPVYLNKFGSNATTMYDNLGCLRPFNEFAKFHNAHLQQAIKELQKQYPNVAIYYGDYYGKNFVYPWVNLHNEVDILSGCHVIILSLFFNILNLNPPSLPRSPSDIAQNKKKFTLSSHLQISQTPLRRLLLWSAFSSPLPNTPQTSHSHLQISSSSLPNLSQINLGFPIPRRSNPILQICRRFGGGGRPR